MRLDDEVPVWHFRERHSIEVLASPARVFESIRSVTAGEIFLFRTLTAIRRFGCTGEEGILNAPEDLPIIEVATRTGFFMMVDEPPRELVLGIYVIGPRRVLAAMNFRVAGSSEGSYLTTETRVCASDPGARLRFGLYWVLIRPGSGFIRRMWLRAIRKRAERGW